LLNITNQLCEKHGEQNQTTNNPAAEFVPPPPW